MLIHHLTTCGFQTAVDPLAAKTRQRIRTVTVKDLASKTMRWALHLSAIEANYLECMNPETLGRTDDERIRSNYWKQFIDSPASTPFKIGTNT